MTAFFEQHFYLRDHPFAPENGRFASPDRPLNLFAGDTLARPYFVRLAGLKTAVDDIDTLLRDHERALAGGKPPALIILGPPGSGRRTVAAYTADMLRQKCRDLKLPEPSFNDVRIPSEDYARLLDRIRGPVLEHLDDNGIDVAKALKLHGPFKASEPNREQHEGLFNALEPKVAALPSLPLHVLAIGPITARRESWMVDLRRLLTPFRVMPVFYTDDSTVAAIFNSTAEQSPKLRVAIQALAPDDAVQLLTARFEVLKSNNRQAAIDPLFPYSDDTIRRLFAGRTSTALKHFIALCSGAFDARWGCLRDHEKVPATPPPAAGVSWQDFESAMRYAGGVQEQP